ncbi:exosortase E/protease, VPEID-CTERM system [Aquisphaera insulae]|uniref:exosortase E/protease, VPEID-CTERM system n=1 Tax=Aquisphaera insulae TaxID=2712864 RepID=UPI0013EC8B12|nr:exosortase E/protease, VPEID-CTERM system [Aquisphaera insulae]
MLPAIAWSTLLLGEVLGLSFSYDIAAPAGMSGRAGLLAGLVAHSSTLIRVAACVVTLLAAATLASARRRAEIPGLLEQMKPTGWLAGGHVACYALFHACTGRLIAAMHGGGNSAGLALLWLAIGALTLASWMLAALPVRAWIGLARSWWKLLAVGLAVGVCAVGAGGATGRLWSSLHSGTFAAAACLLRQIEPDVICDPEAKRLGAGGFSVMIAGVCSGYEGIGLIVALLGGYLVVCRRELRFPRAFLLLPAGVAIIALLNVLRIVTLILIGARGRPEVALGGFHSQAGWLAFNAVGLGLIAGSRRLGLFSTSGAEGGGEDREAGVNPTAAYLGPLMAILAASMVTAALSDGTLDLLYPVRIAAACMVFWAFRKSYPARWRAAWEAPIATLVPIAIGGAAYLAWIALEPVAAADGSADAAARSLSLPLPRALAEMGRHAAMAWLAVRVLGSVIVIPLAEELAFRGYLQRRLIAADFESVSLGAFTWLSFLGPSIAFGLLHQRWLAGTAAGLLYAAAALRRGRLGDAVLAHATTNALIALRVLAGGAWWLWA